MIRKRLANDRDDHPFGLEVGLGDEVVARGLAGLDSLVRTVTPVRKNRAATAPPARAASSATASSCAIIPADLKVPRQVKG